MSYIISRFGRVSRAKEESVKKVETIDLTGCSQDALDRGWFEPTQKDRGLFYQNFGLDLLESKVCVGWQWFKYQDNDPTNLKTDPSNRNSNRGILDNIYTRYQPLMDKMKELNTQVYSIIDCFDARK